MRQKENKKRDVEKLFPNDYMFQSYPVVKPFRIVSDNFQIIKDFPYN